MAEFNFNTPGGQTVARGLMILCLNTGAAEAPVWSPVGKRVTDSSMDFDWSTETSTDIFDETFTTGKKATRTQTFDPYAFDSADEAIKHIWKLGVMEDNVSALLNQDCLIVHLYATDESGAAFAERYSSCAVLPTSLGGEGGGNLNMSVDVTYGGTRTIGTAVKTTDGIQFTADSDAAAAAAAAAASAESDEEV